MVTTTSRRGLGTRACAKGRAEVALLLGGSARALVLEHVHESLKKNFIDHLAESCVNVRTIMRLSVEDASGHRSEKDKFPRVYPHAMRRALDVIKPVAVSFYTPKNYGLDPEDPWGTHCPGVNYFAPVTAQAQFDGQQKLLCTARRIEAEGGFKFSWFIRQRPEFFWYAPPPASFSTALWNGGSGDSEHNFIWDESWFWKINDTFYATHSSLVDALWSQGAAILSKIPCHKQSAAGQTAFLGRGKHRHHELYINPEAALLLAAEHVNAKLLAVEFGQSVRPLSSPGKGSLWCEGSGLASSQLTACHAATRINEDATSKYREQVNAWISSGEHEHDAPVSGFGPTC